PGAHDLRRARRTGQAEGGAALPRRGGPRLRRVEERDGGGHAGESDTSCDDDVSTRDSGFGFGCHRVSFLMDSEDESRLGRGHRGRSPEKWEGPKRIGRRSTMIVTSSCTDRSDAKSLSVASSL